MHFSLFANIYWAVGTGSTLVLIFVLLWRGRWRTFPILTVWLAFLAVKAALLFVIYLYSSRNMYAIFWVVGSWIDFALQLGVVFEIACIVLRPTGTWVRDARSRFVSAGVAAALVSALLAWYVSPPAWSNRYAWQIRGDLFTSLVICELFVVMSLTANRLGLGWRSHVMAVGQGLTAWSGIMVIRMALESYLGTRRFYIQLEQVRQVAYPAAALWMAIQLWRQEPERQPISADLQEYILALHRRVEYDLRRLDARN
jgi:hypothetical protein